MRRTGSGLPCLWRVSLVLNRFLFSFFFFSGPGAPRDLHFPTRRSSDLDCGPGGAEDPQHEDEAADGGTEAERSEEHTSELQSHHDLVCRLLLEKKKYGSRITLNSPHKLPRTL